MTAGFRSTEFWSSAFASIAGGGLLCVGLVRGHDPLTMTGAALLGLSTFAYAHSRGKVKAPRPYLPPQGKL